MERLTERTSVGILVKEDYGKEVLKTLYSCYGGKPNPHYTNCEEGYCAMEKLAAYEDAEEQGLPLRWIPIDEKLPDADEYIIVSFENFTVPMIGRYTVDDDDNGTFRIGDEDESFVENDLYVNAWMSLPKPNRESEG